ncbi:MAG: hypothetical protein NT129_03880 [Candidatus Aenigmarchaeota archaeon]|nr:hypothetical protein [Candidatus Aenigmarchaeota archaeon]
MTEKKGLLPVVSSDTCYSIIQEVSEKSSGDYTIQVLKRLAEDNPVVATFLAEFALKSRDPAAISYTTTILYRMLESQAAADKLERDEKYRDIKP